MNEFQKVLGTPVLLTELRDEQESLVRVVEVHRRIDNVAMDKARKEQERRREQLEKAAEKRLEIIVLVLTVISTMLALLALVSDPNLGLFAVGFILTGIVALIGGIRVKRLLRGGLRRTRKTTVQVCDATTSPRDECIALLPGT